MGARSIVCVAVEIAAPLPVKKFLPRSAGPGTLRSGKPKMPPYLKTPNCPDVCHPLGFTTTVSSSDPMLASALPFTIRLRPKNVLTFAADAGSALPTTVSATMKNDNKPTSKEPDLPDDATFASVQGSPLAGCGSGARNIFGEQRPRIERAPYAPCLRETTGRRERRIAGCDLG